tara:strand:+ start:1823 stop:2131 length:309 start_codon:yes stop_codon:yes gene_type:complete
MKQIDHYVEKAIKNIEQDRATTQVLLTDAMAYLKQHAENHKSTGPVVAKYLETLQRSNEQLVKIAQLVYKVQTRDMEMDGFDEEDIFDQIKNSSEEEKEEQS